jgi:hypothetical protein
MVKLTSKWKDQAVCFDDKYSGRWVSYDIRDIEYAKNGCAKCPVKKECLVSALMDDSFTGVRAGISEYEYLMAIWSYTIDENESNWRRDDSALSRVMSLLQ